jgi:hypothetical protein
VSGLGLMCMIGLGAPARLDAPAVHDALRESAPDSNITVTPRIADDGDGGLAVTIDRQDFAAVSLPGQMPTPVCEAALRGGIFWNDRRQMIETHRGFIAISAAEPALGHGLTRAQAAALTRLAAALARTTPALGLCWPSAGTAVSPERLAQSLEQIHGGVWPVDMWIGYRMLVSDPTGDSLIGARTHGAVAYFGAEVELARFAAADPSEPLHILLNIVGYLMGHGAHLGDGQPIQVQPNQGRAGRRFRVQRHPASGARPGLIRLVPDADAAP